MTRILVRIWLVLLGLSVAGIALGLLMFIISGKAHANAVLAQPMQPIAVNRMVSSSSLVTASTRFAGVTAANQSVYAVRAVEIGKASVANAVRTRSLTPWGFAIVAGLTAADYIFNQQTQQWEVNPEPLPTYMGIGTSCSRGPSNVTMQECIDSIRAAPVDPSVWGTWGYHSRSGDTVRYCFKGTGTTCVNNNFWFVTNPPGSDPTTQWPTTFPLNPYSASDSQLYDFYRNLSPSQQADLLTDPLTGFPDAATIPEFQQAADEITSNWNAEHDGNPDTTPVPNPTEQTSTEPFPEEAQEQDICKANPAILACEEMGELPEPDNIVTQDLDINYSPVSMASSGGCPAPIHVGKGVYFEFDVTCDFASNLKPIVMAFSLILALYIMIGFKK